MEGERGEGQRKRGKGKEKVREEGIGRKRRDGGMKRKR